jgi:hypothetical protein
MNILNHPINALRGMPFLVGSMVIVGAVLGGAVVPAIQGAFEVFDAANPVVSAQATLVKVNSDEVVLHLSGTKERDCQYIGLQAYTRHTGSEIISDAYIQRVDVPETGATRPVGKFAGLGTWRIWPRSGADVVMIYAQHACGGRLVLGKIVEVRLPP